MALIPHASIDLKKTLKKLEVCGGALEFFFIELMYLLLASALGIEGFGPWTSPYD